tara:strand:- start:161 stop:346 length:186 start_codon:yes stop_codon:yes gene_type:complete
MSAGRKFGSSAKALEYGIPKNTSGKNKDLQAKIFIFLNEWFFIDSLESQIPALSISSARTF